MSPKSHFIYQNTRFADHSRQFMDVYSVRKSGPVRSFALKGLRPRPRPVFLNPELGKDRTEPQKDRDRHQSRSFCGYKTGLNRLRLRLVHNRSQPVSTGLTSIYIYIYNLKKHTVTMNMQTILKLLTGRCININISFITSPRT